MLICLFGNGSKLPDGQWFLMLIAVLADIALVCLAVSRIHKYIKKQKQEWFIQKKSRAKELIDKLIGEKQSVINLVSDYEKRNKNIGNLLQLLSTVSDVSDYSLNQIESYFSEYFNQSLQELVFQLPENERKRFPKNYHDIQTYRKALSNELSELYRKISDIDAATTKEEFKNAIGKDFKY